jgi:endonuclease-3
LFQLAKTPEQMSKLKVKDIEKAIYPVGFYKTKARRIKGISKILFDNYNSNVPADFDELLKFNGVGRKTANIVITYGFGKPGIAVDTHVHRISNRLGLVKTKNPHDTEFALKKILPKKYWIVFNKLLVKHGQQTCRPIGPRCFQCVVNDYCKKVGVDKRYYEKI